MSFTPIKNHRMYGTNIASMLFVFLFTMTLSSSVTSRREPRKGNCCIIFLFLLDCNFRKSQHENIGQSFHDSEDSQVSSLQSFHDSEDRHI